MKAALLQMAVLERNETANVARGLYLLEEAAKGHDIMVLPEIWTTGYSIGHLEWEAAKANGSLIRDICSIAGKNSCAIIAGSIAMKREGRVYNTSLAINKEGKIVNIYDKTHLFGLFNEEKYFAPGNNFNAFDLDGVCCGSTICYDLRFPELYRHLALQGAELIFCPAEWPKARGNVWELLLQARAMENQLFMIGVNCAGEFKGAPFYGHSMAVDPYGKIIGEAGDGEEILSVEIDLSKAAKLRQSINVLADVRRELIS